MFWPWLGILLNATFYSGLVARPEESALIYFAGLLTLVAGLAIINAHNAWRGWRVIITVIGWLVVIGGLIRLAAAGKVGEIAGGIYSSAPTLLIVAIVLLVVGGF